MRACLCLLMLSLAATRTLADPIGWNFAVPTPEVTARDRASEPPPTWPPCDLLIVTTDDIRARSTALGAFIEHKQRFGYRVSVATVGEIELSWTQSLRPELFETTDERADRIRAFLKEYAPATGCRWLLLIGNPDPDDPFDGADTVGDVPMKFAYPDYDINPYHAPTDTYYADLSGAWDGDGDGVYGEWNGDLGPGGPDFLAPELVVGRIPQYAADLTPLDSILAKTIAYECEFETGSEAWRASCFMPNPIDWSDSAGREGNTSPVNMAEWIRANVLIPAGFAWHRIYEHEYTHPPYNIAPPPETVPADMGRTCFSNYGGYAAFLAGFGVDSADIGDYPITALTDGRDDTAWETADLQYGEWIQFKQSYASYMDATYIPARIVLRSDDPAHFPAVFRVKIASSPTFSDEFTLLTEKDPPAHAQWTGSAWELVYDKDLGSLDPVGGKQYLRLVYLRSTPQPTVRLLEFEAYSEESKSIRPYVIPTWQEGWGVAYYNTHGSATDAGDIISSWECTQLDDTRPSLVFQKACQNSWPEVTNNLSYSLLAHGAIGGIAATRTSYGWGDMGYRLLMPALILDNLPFGEALETTRQQMAANGWYGWAGYYFDAMRYNLYGDPTVPLFSDRDEDGIPRFWELTAGLDPDVNEDGASDDDGDGATAYEEFCAGTDATSAASVFACRVEWLPEGVAIRFPTGPARAYGVVRADDPEGPWTPCGDPIPGDGSPACYVDEEAPALPSPGPHRDVQGRFYQVNVLR